MRSRQPGMSPEKIAIAVAVTIAAIAGIGGMKNVTGTRSAVARWRCANFVWQMRQDFEQENRACERVGAS